MNAKNELMDSPFSVILNLTTKCNLACKHCFGDYGSRTEMNLNELMKIVDELDRNEVFYINITGGEPTQHPNFKEFIDYLSKKDMFFMLTTNGIFDSATMKEILKNKAHLINVKISLDGYDAETNGFIRGKEGISNESVFNKIIESIKEFNRNKIPVSISTVLHLRNINGLDKFCDLFEKIKVEKWLISPITYVGRADKNRSDLKYNEELKDIICEKIIPLAKKLEGRGISVELVDFALPMDHSRFYFMCGAAVSFCEIHSDGTVSPCALARVAMHEKHLEFDNLLKKPLEEIWNGGKFKKFREWQNVGCRGCKNLESCNRCVPQSFMYFNDALISPPFCIDIGKDLGLTNLGSLRKMVGYKKWKEK